MAESKTIRVPDIGDFDSVPVIELLVSEGDSVEAEQGLLTLESDKATIDVPAPQAGSVEKLLVKEGDTVSEGTEIAVIKVAGKETASEDQAGEKRPAKPKQQTESTGTSDKGQYDCDVVVIGSGPGGYTAAFRAADLGLNTVLVERYESLGGVCLNVGCIPSKALLHTGRVIDEAAAMAAHGIDFGKPKIDIGKLRDFKQSAVDKLTGGLAGMAKKRKVRTITGTAKFSGAHQITIEGKDGEQTLSFAKAIIAAGSQAVKLPGLPWEDERLMDSTDALELAEVPKHLLVVGGGIIGLEMACVYHALGAKVSIVELADRLMVGADKDLAKAYHKWIQPKYDNIWLGAKVTGIKALKSGLKVSFEGGDAPEEATFDRVLVSVGRTPNGNKLDADKAGVEVDERGFIAVDDQMRTNVEHIFAIGDLVGQPMLAHKATHEGKIAAEVCAGMKSAFDARVIPSVAYTDPEVAWVGLTEDQAREQGIEVETGTFPWAASGRAIGQGRTEGFTKLIFEPESERIVGAGIFGTNAGDLIAECALAIEMGCEAADIGLTIHPHPTLSESVGMAAEAFEGTITDLYLPKKQKRG